ncbi:hypothetical protein C7I87_23165 [Mesorhizobium sp. SARCC-RB16n]|nr:hypothetical protein C7I87_23165 [Mesorhizobium sp. SARCC-RB16n]
MLMKATVDLLPPETVLKVWRQSRGRRKYDAMWERLRDRTITDETRLQEDLCPVVYALGCGRLRSRAASAQVVPRPMRDEAAG